MRIDRETLLRSLESVQPGVANRESVEQSSCLVFRDGKVITFDEEVCCTNVSGFEKAVVGAVKSKPMLNILRKLKEEEVEVEFLKDQVKIAGKAKGALLRLEAEITLPLESLEMPKKGDWRKLPEDFSEAIEIAAECAGDRDEQFALTCVHIHPKWVEAMDNVRLARYRIKTGFEEPVLVRRNSVKHIVGLGMTEFAETESWVHFRNASGLSLACRRFLDQYPSLSEHLKVEGEKTNLPPGLAEAADRAEVFSSEDADNNMVIVEMRPGKLRVRGVGVSGNYYEVKKVAWKGKPLSFLIGPKMLIELSKKHNECLISEERLVIDGGRYRFVTCLGKPQEEGVES